jgi:hypothetical protein
MRFEEQERITSGGNRSPANEADIGRLRRITQARYDCHPIRQRNSAGSTIGGHADHGRQDFDWQQRASLGRVPDVRRPS